MSTKVSKENLQEFATKFHTKNKTLYAKKDVEGDIEAIKNAYGTPLASSTVAGMTDHDKIYVYTGSETGYTSGNWYYWNGSAWTSGGVYNSTAFVADTTLAVSGAAADAKTVGDKAAEITNQLSHAEEQFPGINGVILPPAFEIGTRYVNNGQEAWNGNGVKRLSTKRGTYVNLKQGDVVSINKSVLYCYGGGYSADGGNSFTAISTKTGDYTAPADGIYFFWLYKIGEADFTQEDIKNGWKYIFFKRPNSLVDSVNSISEEVDNIEDSVADFADVVFSDAELPPPVTGWIRYSNGEYVESNATNLYIFTSNLPKKIKAFLASDTNALCAIAFYSSVGISTNGYMESDSVDFLSGSHNDGAWYTTNVPTGCKTIAITTKRASATVASAKILFDSFGAVEDRIINGHSFIELPIGVDKINGWIRHGTGELVPSAATECYTIKNNGLSKVRVFTKSDTAVIDAVSFYSGDEISEDTYLQSSVSWYGVRADGAWYDVNIPDNAVLIAISVVKASGAYSPKILFPVSDAMDLFDVRYATNSQIKKSIDEKNDIVLSGGWKYIYHFGMEAVVDRSIVPLIPSQSIFDIRNAHNLGFQCIEANVHKTSDSKYVVTHGVNGALGHDFDDLNGDDAYGVFISGNTLQDLRDNYVYRSSNPDYRVPITTLEEFCHEAKNYNMIVMFQYKDAAEIEIIRGIMGNRFFMYVASRSVYDGPILEYLSYTTKAEILARCNTVGRPYIYSMGNTNSFTDEELQDIINTLHQNGYYLATAYVSGNNLQKLSAMGFDFFAVDRGYVTQETILDGKKIIFNIDGSVTWEVAEV